MSDYIVSNLKLPKGHLSKCIREIYHQDSPKVMEFHGNWGSLAVSKNLYNGYFPYETEKHIMIVLGGPVLTFTDNKKVTIGKDNSGTIEIFQRWSKGDINWSEDLSGPFNILIIDKQSNTIFCITDLMSFIPTYIYKEENKFFLGTHTDALAKATSQEKNIDKVSVVDFILHSIITYPYTIYRNIKQIQPASVHEFTNNARELTTNSYWVPYEEFSYKSIREAAADLRSGLQSYVNSISFSVNSIAQFISGGEDSRTISGLLPKDKIRDAFIFLDNMNREGKVAEKAANSYGARFKMYIRKKTYYLDILPECSDIVGSGSQYMHVHTFGFHKACDLQKYQAVLGGLFSDALLKGARIEKDKKLGIISFLYQKKNLKYSENREIMHSAFNKSIINEISIRRKAHLEYVSSFRKESSDEWFQLWPSSMNMNIPNLHGNRRLFKSFEPFMSKDVVKISASVPQKWKMNRKLFQKAAKPLLKETRWLFHGDGRLPYFPWYVNFVVQFVVMVIRKMMTKVKIGIGNQGPWGEWSIVMKSEDWKSAVENYTSKSKLDTSLLKEGKYKDLLYSDKLNVIQKVNLMQVLYQSIK